MHLGALNVMQQMPKVALGANAPLDVFLEIFLDVFLDVLFVVFLDVFFDVFTNK